MIFLIVSTPRKAAMTAQLIAARIGFRNWIRDLGNKIVCFYPRTGRGAVVIIQVRTRAELNKFLVTWKSFVRTRLDVFPLEDPARSEKKLRTTKRSTE